ncbi:unnamed protein product, partial [Meganyctiphanes norvegica]
MDDLNHIEAMTHKYVAFEDPKSGSTDWEHDPALDRSKMHHGEYSKQISLKTKVKRQQHCAMCRNHNIRSLKNGHLCQLKQCKCSKCNLTRNTQRAMSQQQRQWRAQAARKKEETLAGGESVATTPEIAGG